MRLACALVRINNAISQQDAQVDLFAALVKRKIILRAFCAVVICSSSLSIQCNWPIRFKYDSSSLRRPNAHWPIRSCNCPKACVPYLGPAVNRQPGHRREKLTELPHSTHNTKSKTHVNTPHTQNQTKSTISRTLQFSKHILRQHPRQ